MQARLVAGIAHEGIRSARMDTSGLGYTKDRENLAPLTVGRPAGTAPVLVAATPSGMEAGYVPIAARQGAHEGL